MNNIVTCVAVLLVSVFVGFSAGVHHEQFKQLKTVAERDKLQIQLNAKDVQIQQLQANAIAKKAKVIYKKEVVYRDKVKSVDVRQCIIDSGLLDLYDATVSSTSK